MNDDGKRLQLRKYKLFATGLFVLMAVIFVVMSIWEKRNSAHWIGYIRAFSEAAMVGALADWFAVTALFNHPLGLKIPHTNLIEKSKERIGENLGSFVVLNFLSPQNIRPYILKLKVSKLAGDWLSSDRNQQILVSESSKIALDIVQRLDDDKVLAYMSLKAKDMTEHIQVNKIVGNGLEYIVNQSIHQKMITNLSRQIKNYILNNQNIVRDRVKKESFVLIPKFVDDKIAEKITDGLSKYFEEVEADMAHDIRAEITSKLTRFSMEVQDEPKWENQFRTIKDNLIKEEQLSKYARDIWSSIKANIIQELATDHSMLKNYLNKNLSQFAEKFQTDEALQHKVDHWIRVTAYKYILKNTHQFGNLISSTVGNWQGRELSEKLELEVGKDLQYIRVNGTIVGGLVGLIIYTLTNFFL